MSSRRHESLPRALGRGGARAVLIAVCGLVGTAGGMAVNSLMDTSPTPWADSSHEDDAGFRTADRVARLVSEHACWTGDAPREHAGVMPGHVVVSVDGSVRYSSRLVGAALDHVFTAPRDDMVIHAFCP